MKRTAAIFTGTGEVKARTEELPELKDNEVLIKVYAKAIAESLEITPLKIVDNTGVQR